MAYAHVVFRLDRVLLVDDDDDEEEEEEEVKAEKG